MKISVLKFGGSSISNSEKIKHVAFRITKHLDLYDRIVVVLSAPANITDDLMLIHKAISSSMPPPSLLQVGELISISLMESALKEKKISAIATNHYELSITAEGDENDAKLLSINEKKLTNLLKKHKVLIIPGFIAHNKNMKPLTLGRGGSDYTAVYFSYILSSPCYLYSDIKGIYSADPSQIADAVKLDKVSYSEVVRMIECKAPIRQGKAINFALKKKIKLYLGSSFLLDEKPTEISNDKSDNRIKFISLDPTQRKYLFFIGNGVEKRRDILLKLKKEFPNSQLSFKNDIIILKNSNIIDDNLLNRIHKDFVLR